MASTAPRVSNEDPAPPPVLNDCTPDEAADQRYLDALAGLYAEASAGSQLRALADNLAWTLAHVCVHCGAGATGDVVRLLGTYICRIETRRQAEAEAQQAMEEGRQPH